MKRALHPSIKRATVEPIDGGWVSYVDPQKYPKSHFGETKPYFAPLSIDSLQGSKMGMIKLPITVYWEPDRWFNLSQRSTLRNAYRMILQEGRIEDQNR